jgi:hypothetical protein
MGNKIERLLTKPIVEAVDNSKKEAADNSKRRL